VGCFAGPPLVGGPPVPAAAAPLGSTGRPSTLQRGETLAEGVLGHHAGLHELQEIVGAARLGADTREAMAAERLPADSCPRAGAVHVQVAGPELLPSATDARR